MTFKETRILRIRVPTSINPKYFWIEGSFKELKRYKIFRTRGKIVLSRIDKHLNILYFKEKLNK